MPKTIIEIQKDKKKLERDIAMLIEEFEFETGMHVYMISSSDSQLKKGKPERITLTVHVPDPPAPAAEEPAELKAVA
jgi:hypothetical protein